MLSAKWVFSSSYKASPAKISSIHAEGFGLRVQHQRFQSHMDICVSFFPFLSLFLHLLLHFAAHEGLEDPAREPRAPDLHCKAVARGGPTCVWHEEVTLPRAHTKLSLHVALQGTKPHQDILPVSSSKQ